MSNFYSLSDEDESESQLSRMANSSRGESSRMGGRGAADTTNDTSISRGDNSRRKSRNQSSNEIAAEDDDDSWMNDESSEQRRERRRRRLGLTNDNNQSTSSGRRSNGMDLDLPSTSRNNQSNTFGFGNVPNFIPELNFDDENLNMSQEDESDISKLARAWANERASPEILDWMEEITTNVVDEVNQQVGIVEQLASDASTSDEEHFRLSLVQLDVERAKWLLRAYLRSRLDKIERFSSHIVNTPSAMKRLSEVEKSYVRNYHSIRTSHFQRSILDNLPDTMRGLDDATQGGDRGSMTVVPDLEKPVFIRCRDDCGGLRINATSDVQLTRGSIHLLRYKLIRHLLDGGRIELL